MIKVDFRGFWKGFNHQEVIFFKYLFDEGFLVFDNKNPHVIIYSDNFTKVDKLKPRVFYSPENQARPNHLFKYTLTYHKDSDTNFRLNNFFYYPFFREVTDNNLSKKYLSLRDKEKSKHINFIYRNSKGEMRNSFFKFLAEFYPIDSYGKHFNNMGVLPTVNNDMYSGIMQKFDLISNYKYTIAFENSFGVDYISEKIWQPLAVNSIPIYWGSPAVFDFFNKKKIIYLANKNDFKKTINKIRNIDQSSDLYQKYLNEPIFKNEAIKFRYSYLNLAKRLVNYLSRIAQDDPGINNKLIKHLAYLLEFQYKKLF